MPRRDSLDKIVLSYFAAITSHPFVWRDEVVEPMALSWSSTLLRGFTCPAMCGGCCPTFSLDYLPDHIEPHPYPLEERIVQFDGREVTVYEDSQDANRGPRCQHLNSQDGRCGIHGRQPFSCDFELIRFSRHSNGWRVSERLFGRGPLMKRVDGGVGALCEITPADPETALDVARRLDRLTIWADYFGLRRHRSRLLADYCRTYAYTPDQAPPVRIEP